MSGRIALSAARVCFLLAATLLACSEATPPDPATTIALHQGAGQDATVGSSVTTPPSVLVTTANGTPVANVAVTFAVTAGSGSLTGATQSTNADGIATVGSWTLGTVAGANAVSATSTGLTGSPITFTATGTAGPAATIAANAGDAQSAVAGHLVGTAPSVIVRDTYDNVVAGASVTFAIGSGGGQLTGASQTTDAGGVATVGSWTLGVTGPNSLTATVVAVTQPLVFNAIAKAPFAELSVGFSHVCGMTASALYCWGSNTSGQYGIGTKASSTEPVSIGGTVSFVSVSAAYTHSCGLTTNGTAYCWGKNNYGQLGDGTTTESLVPTQVNGSLSFASLSVSNVHSCGLTATGAAYCWGRNANGALGIGEFVADTIVPTPTAVLGSLSFKSIHVGNGFTCALTPGNVAYCWGFSSFGERGDGTLFNAYEPIAVAGGHTFVSLAVGDRHSCGVTTTGAAYCWGFNTSNQLGVTTGACNVVSCSTLPVAVSGGLIFSSIAVGANFSCALTSAGAVHCWGANQAGQLGDNSNVASAAPVAVSGGLTFSRLFVGGQTACGLTSLNAAYCWGAGSAGQIGDGGGMSRTTPTLVRHP